MSPDHDNVWKSFNIQYLRNQVWVSCSNQKTIGDCVCVLFDMVIGTWRLGEFTFNQPSMRIKSFRGQKVFVFWVETWCAQLIRLRIENNNKVFHRKQVVLKIFLPQQILLLLTVNIEPLFNWRLNKFTIKSILLNLSSGIRFYFQPYDF